MALHVVVLRAAIIVGARIVKPRRLIVRIFVSSEQLVRRFFHRAWPFGLPHDYPVVRVPNHATQDEVPDMSIGFIRTSLPSP